jgi:small-conductance mechanosensitive channel
VVLVIGWIAGRLLGKAARIVIDKVTATASSAPLIGESDVGKSVIRSSISLGYVGDITVRCIVYLIAILGAVDILNLDYLSKFMTTVVEYIPHVVAFVIILVIGIILIDFFIDFFRMYSRDTRIELLSPVLVLLRIFLYFVVIMLALSQLMLDLTIIYTIITPLAWGLGIGLGAAIAIIVWFGMKNRSEEIVNKVMEVITR